MKVRVIESFIDKETNNVRNVKEVFECTEKRMKEINGKYNHDLVVAEPIQSQSKENHKGE